MSRAIARGPAWTAIAAAGAFGLITGAAAHDRLLPLDTAGIDALRTLGAGWSVSLMQALSFLAGNGAVPIALLIAAALWHRRRGAGGGGGRIAAFYAATCLSGWAANLLIKEIVHHHRPVGLSPKLTAAGWYSYPSGHAMLAVLVFGVGADLLTRGARPWVRALALTSAAALIAGIAVSRVYLGAHWPSDVVGALLAGIAWGAGAEALYGPDDRSAPYTAA